MPQRPGPVVLFLAALTLLVGSGVAQAQSKPGPGNATAAGPPQPDPSPAAVKRTRTAATPTTSHQPTSNPAPATRQPVAPVTQAPTPTRVSAPPARPTVQATQPTVHHKTKAALAKPAARPHKPPVKKAQPRIVTKPVVKATRFKAGRPAVKVPVAAATPASSLSPSVAAHGGFLWSLTLPQALLLVGLMAAAAFVLVARSGALTGAMAHVRARAMARRRRRARAVASWPPELWLEPVLNQPAPEPVPEPVRPEPLLSEPALEPVSEPPPEQLPEPLSDPLPPESPPRQPSTRRRSLPRPVLRRREAPAMEDSDEWLEIQARIQAISLSRPPGTRKPVSVETEKPASVEGGPEPEPIPSRGALPTDR